MMISDIVQLHETLDQQKGIQDGISLAYNIGKSDLVLSQALATAVHRNEFYQRGLIEGFRTIVPKGSENV